MRKIIPLKIGEASVDDYEKKMDRRSNSKIFSQLVIDLFIIQIQGQRKRKIVHPLRAIYT